MGSQWEVLTKVWAYQCKFNVKNGSVSQAEREGTKLDIQTKRTHLVPSSFVTFKSTSGH